MDGTFGNSDILPAFVPVHEPWLFSVQALLFACFQLLVFSRIIQKKLNSRTSKTEVLSSDFPGLRHLSSICNLKGLNSL
jgi:hypothetical protein